MDKGEVTALTLISTPLTMLHYLIHFQIGMEYLHIHGQGQIWFSSYLQNRHQSVKIKESVR